MTNTFEQATENRKISLKGLVILSRLPFLLPGIAACITGIGIALAWGYIADMGLIGISIIGLAFIMLATYYYNEYFDFEGDAINKKFTEFSGGSRAIPNKLVARPVARIAGLSAIIVLVLIMIIYFAFYFTRFPYLFVLAIIGAFCGIFYSHPPFQWAYRGIGEIMIGSCYGVLAVVSGFYIVSGILSWELAVIALPASFTIFCVITANEFPDIEADRAVNKRNLVVIFGLEKGAMIYMIAFGLTYPLMLLSILVGVNWMIAIFGLPVLILTMIALVECHKGGYAIRASQKKISAITLIVNLMSSLLFLPVVLIW